MRARSHLLMVPVLAILTGTLEGAVVVSDDFGSNRFGWNAVDGVGSWTRHPNGDLTFATIIDTDPVVAGGGSYMSVRVRTEGTTDVPGPSPAGSYSVRKRTSATAIDTTLPHTVSFDFRVDSSLASFSTFNDRFYIGASTESATGTGPNNTWAVSVHGDPGTTGIAANYWYFHDRNQNTTALNADNVYVTAVPLVDGVVYSFVITVDPASASYSVALTSSVGNAYASDLGFRNGAVGGKGDLIFMGGNVDQMGEGFEFSADNVLFVPEPGSAMLLALSAAGLLAKRRRI